MNNPLAPFVRVTKVTLRVVREVETKLVEKSTGRVLHQTGERVRRREGKEEEEGEGVITFCLLTLVTKTPFQN